MDGVVTVSLGGGYRCCVAFEPLKRRKGIYAYQVDIACNLHLNHNSLVWCLNLKRCDEWMHWLGSLMWQPNLISFISVRVKTLFHSFFPSGLRGISTSHEDLCKHAAFDEPRCMILWDKNVIACITKCPPHIQVALITLATRAFTRRAAKAFEHISFLQEMRPYTEFELCLKSFLNPNSRSMAGLYRCSMKSDSRCARWFR
ncbi:hypothetical protein VNO77_21743 [Canavalia gladiata]|uniref:Uncharacterized protein n=1 Tax=Canavalia gladiata TaxID=3824 RepID=A0AAN9L4K4_CANGL